MALGDEVEEADELATVVDHCAQVRPPRRVREQVDPPRVGRRVVPLVRELVPPLGDLGRLLVGDRLDVHGMEPTVATQRAAASRSAAGRLLERAAQQEARRERVPRAGRIHDVAGDGGEVELRVLAEHAAAACAPLEHAERRRQVRAAEQLPLGLRREEHVGCELVEEPANCTGP